MPVVRPARASDHAAILQLGAELRSQLENPSHWNWSETQLANELAVAETWVAEERERILGFICYRAGAEDFEITVLATTSGLFRQGVQTLLIQYFQVLAAEQRKSIRLEVHAGNEPALQLYKKQGFNFLRRRKAYYADGGDALELMWAKDKAGC